MNLQFAFLEGDELCPAIERSREEWNREKGRDDYQRFMRALKETPWGRAHWRAPALRAEGGVAATMFLYDFTFALENARVRVCAIASFGVRRDLRGRGIGRRLMEEAHGLLAREGYDAALLYSLIDPGYYERLGYTVLPTQHLEAGMDGWREAGPRSRTPSGIRPYEPRDFPSVRNLYNTHVSAQRMACLREDDYWEFDIMRERLLHEMFSRKNHPWAFLVGEREGRVVSYLRTRFTGDDTLRVLEYGFEAGAKEDVTAMLRFLMERLEREGVSRLRGKVPSRFVNLCPARQFRWEEKRLVMVRPIRENFLLPPFAHPDEYFHWTIDLL